MEHRRTKHSWIPWIAAIPIFLVAAAVWSRQQGASNFEPNALLAAGGASVAVAALLLYRSLRQAEAAREQAESEARQAALLLSEKTTQLSLRNRELDLTSVRIENLEKANADLQQFASVASHDLQEPLRMVVSYLGLLEQTFHGKLGNEQEKFMKFAVDGARRMQALVRDLQSYSEAGSQPPVLTSTKLTEVLNQARYSLLESVRATGAEISAETLPELEVDPLKLSLIFQHLLSNAIKFRRNGEKPVVHIEARQEDAAWRISVRDHGIGFDPKYSEKIFGAFQRLHGRNEYPGTGIGLALCKRLVEAHGGRIWAEGSLGEGAAVHFTLPALMENFVERNHPSNPAISHSERSGTEPRTY